MPVYTRIQVRRDSAANWTSVNPLLGEGEIGLETDTGKFKIGDNTNQWTALGYKGGPVSAFMLTLLDDTTAAAARATLIVEPEAVQTVYVTPAQSLTSTTVVAVTGLVLTLAAGTYDIRAWLEYSSADATVGLKVGMTCTNFTSAVLTVILWDEIDGSQRYTLRASGDTAEATQANNANDHMMAQIEGRLVVSGSATFQITGGRQTDTGGFTVTAHAGRILASKVA